MTEANDSEIKMDVFYGDGARRGVAGGATYAGNPHGYIELIFWRDTHVATKASIQPNGQQRVETHVAREVIASVAIPPDTLLTMLDPVKALAETMLQLMAQGKQ